MKKQDRVNELLRQASQKLDKKTLKSREEGGRFLTKANELKRQKERR
jgi:hypothetical protein